MNQNFVRKSFSPDIAGAAAGMNPIGAGLAGAQTALGIIQTISGAAKEKKLLAQRTAYKTPEEYSDILKATQSLASQGYDAFTLNFLTNQTDRAFDQSTSAATRLGANPNDLSSMFDQKMQGIMKIGAENHALNMENMGKYFSALDVMGQNKAAEWSSQQDILKDKLQAASAEKAAGVQNIGSGANAAIGLSASQKTSDLYKQMFDALKSLKKGQSYAGAGAAGVGSVVSGLGAGALSGN